MLCLAVLLHVLFCLTKQKGSYCSFGQKWVNVFFATLTCMLNHVDKYPASVVFCRKWGYRPMGPQCLPTPPVSASSFYAAVVCVGGLGSVCYVLSISPVSSDVLCEFKYALSNSLFLSFFLSVDLSPRTMPRDYLARWLLAVPSPPGHAAAPVSTVLPAAMEPWPLHRTCYLSQTCSFQLSRDSRSGRDTLNDRLWKANWHLLLRCWLAALSTTTVIIIIWPCWSFMNIEHLGHVLL